MKIIRSIQQFQLYRSRLQNKQIGFIPTMGALHAGHLSLVEQSLDDFQHTIVSIFVNPTQFDNKNDLNHYPNLLEQDIEKLKQAGVKCVFLPNFDEIYPDNYAFSVVEKTLSKKYCGAHRDGHFDGVLTIVMKLLNIVRPTKAYFGEKDFQQLTLIRKMVEAFFIPVDIVAGATIREADGLAMSSRNLNLTAEQRKIAPKLYATIRSGKSLTQMQKQLESYGFKVDYLEFMDNRLLVAAYLGKVRLIDNVAINSLEHVA
ncbi:MAG TPA: pantoate--beta-alanine ligase [Oceanospirillales bacterium]|nr:pantoate--beta-alanine ligase [Oceanospirillales bacterium]